MPASDVSQSAVRVAVKDGGKRCGFRVARLQVEADCAELVAVGYGADGERHHGGNDAPGMLG